jgi:hypothetical protein
VPPDDAEHPADEAGRGPVREGDAPARPAHPHQLGRGPLVVAGEHHADRGQHVVDRLVRDGQRLGVRLPEVDGESLRVRAPARGLEQGGHVVDAEDVGEAAGRGDGDVTGSGRDVQDAGAGARLDGVDERLRQGNRQPGDPAVVTAAPGGVLLGLELVEGGDGGHESNPFRGFATGFRP